MLFSNAIDPDGNDVNGVIIFSRHNCWYCCWASERSRAGLATSISNFLPGAKWRQVKLSTKPLAAMILSDTVYPNTDDFGSIIISQISLEVPLSLVYDQGQDAKNYKFRKKRAILAEYRRAGMILILFKTPKLPTMLPRASSRAVTHLDASIAKIVK